MKRITIVNAHWSNRGDEAALRPILNRLLADGDNRITVIFKDRNEVQGFPYPQIEYFSTHYLVESPEVIQDCIHHRDNPQITKDLQRTIDTVCNSDLVVYSPGGAVISSRFWWSKQLEYLSPLVCAAECEIPFVIAAPSMGPFEQEDDKNAYIRRYLLKARRLIVREPLSRDYLGSIGGGRR